MQDVKWSEGGERVEGRRRGSRGSNDLVRLQPRHMDHEIDPGGGSRMEDRKELVHGRLSNGGKKQNDW